MTAEVGVCSAYGGTRKARYTAAEAEAEAERSGTDFYHCPTCEALGHAPRTWHTGRAPRRVSPPQPNNRRS